MGIKQVGRVGFEPTTHGLKAGRSAQRYRLIVPQLRFIPELRRRGLGGIADLLARARVETLVHLEVGPSGLLESREPLSCSGQVRCNWVFCRGLMSHEKFAVFSLGQAVTNVIGNSNEGGKRSQIL